MIAFTGLIFQPEECRRSVVPNVRAEQRTFKNSEILRQEIEVQRAAYKVMEKYPLSLSLLPPGSVVHKLHSINCGANHAGISINLHRPEAGTQLAAQGLFFLRPWLAARWMKGTKKRSSFAATEKGVRIQEMFPKCLSVNS